MITAQRHINAYAAVALETGVAAADPHKLILMLYNGALSALRDAQNHMQRLERAAKGEAISKAMQIIDEGLRGSLDRGAGGEIAARLDELYDYMCRRLLLANLRNDPAIVSEVHGLLSQLKEAWEAIGGEPASSLSHAGARR